MVLNTKISETWNPELHIVEDLPTFEDGRAFKVKIECLQEEFKISFDGKVGDILLLILCIKYKFSSSAVNYNR